MNILDEIFYHKRAEVARQKQIIPLAALRAAAEASPLPPDFKAALRRPAGARPRLIAEVKKASPSRGLLLPDFDPLRLAALYKANGAAAISVLTDEKYFQGSLEYLRQVAAQPPCLPVLRKDFIEDPYQIYEARQAGASAILLIAAALDKARLRDLMALAGELNLAALLEVHNLTEIEIANALSAPIIGINNRDLKTFKVDLELSHSLRPCIPPGVIAVAESGIHTSADVDRLMAAGMDAILVGEALVTAPDVAAQVRSLST